MAWTSDAFKPRNDSQTIFQRSVKTSEGEAGQTPDDMDNNYSTRPEQERHIYTYINLRDVNAIEEHLESMCHDRAVWKHRVWKARCRHAWIPRDVTTEQVFVMMMCRISGRCWNYRTDYALVRNMAPLSALISSLMRAIAWRHCAHLQWFGNVNNSYYN